MHKLKIYFDTTCWIRTVETNLNKHSETEKTIILDILEMVEQNSSQYEIVSCQTQLNQLYVKKNSSRTSADMKEALIYAIAQIEVHCNNTIDDDPANSNLIRDQLQEKISLPDNEDAKHIAIAWLQDTDYFITTDRISIINININKRIENALASMQNPNSNQTGKVVKICSPESFLQCIKSA